MRAVGAKKHVGTLTGQ